MEILVLIIIIVVVLALVVSGVGFVAMLKGRVVEEPIESEEPCNANEISIEEIRALSDEECKSSRFFKIMRKVHPDKNEPCPKEAEEKTKELNEKCAELREIR